MKDLALASRLQELADEHRSVNAFATQIGFPRSLVMKYLDGAVPGLDKAAQIAERANVSLMWLATGSGPKPRQDPGPMIIPGVDAPDLTLIPRLEIEAAAGSGALAFSEEPVALLAFDSEWLRRRGINPKYAHVLTARGDSMEPTIRSGDVLLVDTSIDRIEDAGIYIVRVGGLLLVKRINVRMNKSLTLISDNREVYPPEDITADEASDLFVAGRVMWFGRSI